MNLRYTVTHLIAAVAFTLAAGGGNAQETEGVFQVGDAAIRVPTPQGFSETSRRSKGLWELALSYAAGDARIIGHFVTEEDLVAFESGDAVTFKEFLFLQTPRRTMALTATQAQFDKLRSTTAALQADLARRIEPRLAAELEKVFKALSSAEGVDIELRVGEVVPVSVDRNDARVLIFTMLGEAGVVERGSSTYQNMVATTAYCFVAGKVIILTVYRHFRSPRDLHLSRIFMNSWADTVLSAN
ncbi:MAG: hypothetical protein R3E87_02720 [Burkholderiaceae bacterium]